MQTLIFPLKLMCGHTTSDMCSCHKERPSTYKSNGDSPIDKALEQFQGRWADVLGNYGVQLPQGRKHGPCPVCGGKDRFRYDNKDQRGTWFCSQCDVQSGGGLLLLSRYLGKPTIEVAKELVGDDSFKSTAPKRIYVQKDTEEARLLAIDNAKKGAQLLLDNAELSSHVYMDNKGLHGQYLTNGDPIYSKGEIIPKNALLLVPFYKKGVLTNMQKITSDGTKRPIYGGDMAGVQHIIDGKAKSIAIVEGYATGITVNLMTGYKTYCGYNTGNLESACKQAKADHPDARIIIFADHDELDESHNRRPGEYFANEAAITVNALVVIPPELGDWDDYRQVHGVDKCKQAMRDAILLDSKKHAAVVEAVQAVVIEPEPINIPIQPFGSWLDAPRPQKREKKKTGIDALPDGITFDGLDIDQPPGLAGDIVNYIRNGAYRVLGNGAYAAYAIQCMAMAGAGLKGYGEGKLSLVTITLGVSASGKERPQKVIKSLLRSAGVHVYGDIRSDKDVIRAAVYDSGKCFYVIDEAQKLLGEDSGANKNLANVISVLMELATTDSFSPSKLHQDEFITSILAKTARLEKQLTAKMDIMQGYNKEHEKPKIEAMQLEINKLNKLINESDELIKSIEQGIRDPSLNLAASSTPAKLAAMVNEENIEQGFLGRGLVFDCGSERSDLNWALVDREGGQTHEETLAYERLKAEIGMIKQMAMDCSSKRVEDEFNGNEFRTIASPESKIMMRNIKVHYSGVDYRNHSRLGALYARLPERVDGLASIMALHNVIDGNIVIEPMHVNYALMVAVNSIKTLSSNLKVNEAKDGKTVEDKLEGIKEAILRRLDVDKNDDQEGWRYLSAIKRDLKRQKYYQDIAKELLLHSQDAFNNALMSLTGEGLIENDGKKIRLIK